MATEDAKSKDFYGVLGLKKEESTTADIRHAYKKLAMKWHPDRCSGHVKQAEEGKKKFQAIQEAYSVLSDSNKRFLYDVGVYDTEDEEDENGMGDFLDEMVAMMGKNKSSENGEESFKEMQELFDEIFQNDFDALDSSSAPWGAGPSSISSAPPCSNEHYSTTNNKRTYSQMSLNAPNDETNLFEGFHMGTGGTSGKVLEGEEGCKPEDWEHIYSNDDSGQKKY